MGLENCVETRVQANGMVEKQQFRACHCVGFQLNLLFENYELLSIIVFHASEF